MTYVSLGKIRFVSLNDLSDTLRCSHIFLHLKISSFLRRSFLLFFLILGFFLFGVLLGGFVIVVVIVVIVIVVVVVVVIVVVVFVIVVVIVVFSICIRVEHFDDGVLRRFLCDFCSGGGGGFLSLGNDVFLGNSVGSGLVEDHGGSSSHGRVNHGCTAIDVLSKEAKQTKDST